MADASYARLIINCTWRVWPHCSIRCEASQKKAKWLGRSQFNWNRNENNYPTWKCCNSLGPSFNSANPAIFAERPIFRFFTSATFAFEQQRAPIGNGSRWWEQKHGTLSLSTFHVFNLGPIHLHARRRRSLAKCIIVHTSVGRVAGEEVRNHC